MHLIKSGQVDDLSDKAVYRHLAELMDRLSGYDFVQNDADEARLFLTQILEVVEEHEANDFFGTEGAGRGLGYSE